ncbi:MAG: TonB-dependent receptor [Gammaproteobacteria bacterium]|nr:TonB-dependent receptor [Gammaproteobacteria bacterium]
MSGVSARRINRALWAALAMSGGAAAQDGATLLDLSIEELGQLEVTSVSRRAERRDDAPASVYVITGDEIRRAGVRTLPEALRLAPGVEVARNGAHSWTISMRGFSSDLSNKLLVLIDGRSVYSPLYAGVFWDAQDVFMEDVDRIEVIAGPGGTLWGSNAVNGVVNVITRSAWETDGGFARLGGGQELDALAGLRYTGRIGEDIALRGYVKHVEQDGVVTAAGEDAGDDWQRSQAGFRLDSVLTPTDSLTVQGDVYGGDEHETLRGDFTLGTLPEEYRGTVDVGGHNLLARWERDLDGGAGYRLQAYVDHTDRDIPGTFREKRTTVDVEFQHDVPAVGRHELVWGAGLRRSSDELLSTTFATFDPAERTDRTYSLFMQDRIDVRDGRLFLTLGTKLEHNDYTGSEHQPNARVTWLASDRQTLWAAVSRAVRIPARLNEDLELLAPVRLPDSPLPLYVNVTGREDFESEELLAREIGYRISLRRDLSFDVTLYEHEYESLASNEAGTASVIPGPPAYLLLPIVQGNGIRGDTYGGTLAVNWQPIPRWRLEMQYSRLRFDLENEPGSNDVNGLDVAGNSPEDQMALQSYVELPGDFSLYTAIRRVDGLPNQNVPSYTAVDANFEWRPNARLTASLTARNLNDSRHAEFGEGREVERSGYLTVDWRF